MNVAALERLFAEWRQEAAILRRRGAVGHAHALESCAADLEERLRRWGLEELTVPQAAAESGYTQDHIRELVREGKIPDARPEGSAGRIHIRRSDLPRKPPSHEPHLTPVDAMAEKVLAARR
ncbi:MAG: helix-turn-helix domain-containing protein [Gemmatimonadetes bacterium]|nr:helix-turn-helix domain-containing protein [Gemmatimonadota bacterium]